jgi:hypothetical protein
MVGRVTGLSELRPLDSILQDQPMVGVLGQSGDDTDTEVLAYVAGRQRPHRNETMASLL